MLFSEMVVCEGNTDLPGSVRRIACDRNVPSLPVTDTAALPLWPLPFQLMLLSGKKQQNLSNMLPNNS